MAKQIEWEWNHLPKAENDYLETMDQEIIREVQAFHQTFPEYSITPLVALQTMEQYLGVANICIKDESYRFGLNAFKVLGGSYAIAKYLRNQSNIDTTDYTFFTATDGNHGRGVAWAANRLGQKAVVYMPKGTTIQRLKNIAQENATVTIEEANYDECVRMAAARASMTPNSVIVQDTAWEGYEEIPTWIMQGYGTMAMEADEQFLGKTGKAPTHIFIQAGVGSLAGAVLGYFVQKYKENAPKIIVVEASKAACLYKGAKAGDGTKQIVEGDMDTIMAGLACGEPNTISWDMLRSYATCFLSCEDSVARLGMRMLAAPLKTDAPIISGESGAAGFGAFATIMLEPEYYELKEKLGLNGSSRVLCFSTEGDTDPKRFRDIVWRGKER